MKNIIIMFGGLSVPDVHQRWKRLHPEDIRCLDIKSLTWSKINLCDGSSAEALKTCVLLRLIRTLGDFKHLRTKGGGLEPMP